MPAGRLAAVVRRAVGPKAMRAATWVAPRVPAAIDASTGLQPWSTRVRDEVDDARRHLRHGERERDGQQRNGPVVSPPGPVGRDDRPGALIGMPAR